MTILEVLTVMTENSELHDISQTAATIFGGDIRCYITPFLNVELQQLQNCYTDGGSTYVDMLRDIAADLPDESGVVPEEALFVCEIFGVPGCCVFVWMLPHEMILLIADKQSELEPLFQKLSTDATK